MSKHLSTASENLIDRIESSLRSTTSTWITWFSMNLIDRIERTLATST